MIIRRWAVGAPTVDLVSGLVAVWNCEEASGPLVDSVNSISLVESAGTSPVYQAEGKLGYAVANTHVSNWGGWHNTSGLFPSGDFSLTGWVYQTAWQAYTHCGLYCSGGGHYRNLQWTLYGSSSSVVWIGDPDEDESPTYYGAAYLPTLSLETWYHWALVRNSGYSSFYWNGAKRTNTANAQDTLNMSSYDWKIEIRKQRLDQVCLWNRALGAIEVAALYNSGSGLAYPW